MQKYFTSWILGTLEDNPIPYEIRNVYFCLNRENGYIFISFGGSEQPLKQLINFEYFPLDAQFFPIQNQNTFSLHSLKTLLQKSFSSPFLQQNFTNFTIFFGVWGEKDIYKL